MRRIKKADLLKKITDTNTELEELKTKITQVECEHVHSKLMQEEYFSDFGIHAYLEYSEMCIKCKKILRMTTDDKTASMWHKEILEKELRYEEEKLKEYELQK